jgi:hypothetical protein
MCYKCQPWVLCSKNLLLAILPPAVAVVDRWHLHPHLMLSLLHHFPDNNTQINQHLGKQFHDRDFVQTVGAHLFLLVLNGSSTTSLRGLGVAEVRFWPPSKPEEVTMPMDRSMWGKICEARCMHRSCDPRCSRSCFTSSLMWLSSVTTSWLPPPLQETPPSISLSPTSS